MDGLNNFKGFKMRKEDEEILKEARQRFKACEEWEAQARIYFEADYKFANGDSDNMYQWPDDIAQGRSDANRPCLTINKTKQHNLMIINDAKQNKPGVNIRPVSDEASFEAAQVFQEMVRHVEYISGAENVYDHGMSYAVEAGWGYWRVETDYKDAKTFDQEVYIRRIKNPLSVYLDCDINEVDGSDARYGFIFEDLAKDLFEDTYPQYKDNVGWGATFAGLDNYDGWLTRDKVRVAEYYRKTQKKKKLVSFHDPETNEDVLDYWDELEEVEKTTFNIIKNREQSLDPRQRTYNERNVLTDNIEWFKIAGDKIIDRGPWLGKYVPIVRMIGTETVIDGIYDCKGHTRALKDAQRMYNYNTSANVEYGALQTKSPWIAPTQAIEGYEEYWKTANTTNHSYLPYNGLDEDGNQIGAPSRPAAPQASQAYVEQLKIAQNEMMMVSGQYQAQLGENENAKSGVAINARQRQGDRATYHFIDNQAIAIRYTGKILIDLLPKVYDTKRVMRITARDGTTMNVTVDPNAEQAYQKQGEEGVDRGEKVVDIIFNPSVGNYDVMADTGPSFATRRQEAWNALTQIATQDPEFMKVAGDIMFKVADFPEADVLAQRMRRTIDPNILGDKPNAQFEQAMQQAADKIDQLTALVAKQSQDIANKDRELDVKEREVSIREKETEATQARLDYEAETKRTVALGNSGPAITPEQIQPVVQQLLRGMMEAGEPGSSEGVDLRPKRPLPVAPTGGANGAEGGENEAAEPEGGEEEEPPVDGAKKAQDGRWYIPDPNRPGKYLMVEENENA